MTKMQETKTKQDTNFNIQKLLNIGHCVLLVSCLLFLVSSAPAVAQTDLSSGYSLRSPGNDWAVTVAPNTITRSLFVDFHEVSAWPKIPADKVLVSKVYYYAFLPAADNRLDYPLTLSAVYPETETRFKEIFVYDEPTNSWRHLTGTIDTEARKLGAQTLRASSFVAVMADKISRSEYVKEDIDSPTLIVADASSGEILMERGGGIKRPIASLTKMMTAAVFLENNPGWNKKIAMQKADDTIPAKIYVKTGDRISIRDLFYATLVHSANNAAKALARSTGLSPQAFVNEMNKKAKELGMDNTRFTEPTGLSAGNVSTAEDYLKLSQALLENVLFLQATTLKKYSFTVSRGKKTVRMTVANSNKILESPFTITGSKTGYTAEAGRCLMIRAKNAGREVIAITMGATKPGTQWTDMNLLLDAALSDKTTYKLSGQ